MKALIETFYMAFAQQDSATMLSCYHDDVVFTDPVFGTLTSEDARKMWTMLCANAKNLHISYSQVEVTTTKGSSYWEARYIFSKTQRAVHNRIQAQFEFKDGKIIRHIDDFNLRSWASQAMGWKGMLFGGTTFFQKKLRTQALHALHKFNPTT